MSVSQTLLYSLSNLLDALPSLHLIFSASNPTRNSLAQTDYFSNNSITFYLCFISLCLYGTEQHCLEDL